MRRFLIVAVVAGVALLIAAACGPPAPNHAGFVWQKTFTDEFNDNTINTAKWSKYCDWNYGFGCDDFNGGRAHYVADHVTEGFGVAALSVTPMPGDQQDPTCQNPSVWAGQCTYQAGMLSTARAHGYDPVSTYKYKFARGYAEARIKIMGKPGLFSSWWTLTANDASNAEDWSVIDAEMDIMENRGAFPRTAFMDYHSPPNRTGNNFINSIAVEEGGDNGDCTTVNLANDFHTYGLHWRASYVAWYIDGVKCGQKTLTTTDKPMYLVLAPMVDTTWERDANAGIGSSRPSGAMTVDWVRVWQEVPG